MLSLPVEVLEIIIQATSTQDQLILCILCKLFNELAVRCLYKRIDLAKSPRITVSCCKTLISNEAAARSVRSIQIADDVAGSHYLRAYYYLVGKVLRLLPSVAELVLRISAAPLATIIDHCFLPKLQYLLVSSSSSTVTASVVAFIRRHPQIWFLSCNGTSFTAHDIGIIALPALTVYHGLANIIPNLLSASPVRKLNVVWNINVRSLDDETRDYHGILASMAVACVECLTVTTQSWSLNLVSAISKSFPLSKHILFREVTMASGGVTTEAFCDSLHKALPLFQHLLTITLAHVDERLSPVTLGDLDNEFETVTSWGSVCPSLYTCTFTSGVTWYRMPQPGWLPQMDGSNRLLLIQWQFLTMASGKYPTLTQCILEIAQHGMSPADIQLLAPLFRFDLQSGQDIAVAENETDVGSEGDSGEEVEESEDSDDTDQDDESEENPDSVEWNQDGTAHDDGNETDAESEGGPDGEEGTSASEEEI